MCVCVCVCVCGFIIFYCKQVYRLKRPICVYF